jgi:small subunit ribosomal protein S13
MARIAGVDLPPNKRIEIGLTYIYGIGRSQANAILTAAGVSLDTKVRDLNDEETNKIRKIIEEQHRVEVARGAVRRVGTIRLLFRHARVKIERS